MIRENEIEKYLVDKVNRVGRAYKFTSPGRRAVPDRLLALPGGRLILVECKAPGEKLRPDQNREAASLWAMGIKVHVVSTKEEVDELMEAIRRGTV